MGHVSVELVWRAVMKDERLGLKVRWAFLGTYAWTACSGSDILGREVAEIESHVLILL